LQCPAKIQATVNFRGQIATLRSEATFAKDLNVICQVVEEDGANIAGGVTGSYQAKK